MKLIEAAEGLAMSSYFYWRVFFSGHSAPDGSPELHHWSARLLFHD
jgi:hypothetical protein